MNAPAIYSCVFQEPPLTSVLRPIGTAHDIAKRPYESPALAACELEAEV
jgi:hypothetical protein